MSAVIEKTCTASELESLAGQIGRNLFAVVDACDEPQVLGKIAALGESGTCLYAGNAKEKFRDIAPYLVTADQDLLKWVEQSLAGRPWGLFLVSDAPMLEVRRHLRRFLLAKLPDQRTVYFRFYDPRVISTFIRNSSEQERADFFGPIERLIVPNEGSDQFIEFTPACAKNLG